MKTKQLYFFAAAAMLFAACTKDDPKKEEVSEKAPQAITFDTYVPNATRAGAAGVMTTTTLQTTGFGVFAQQGAAYSATADPNANFMYNQAVTIENSAWTYTPLKYWPNETATDSNGATSTDTEGLSFFAYAPYVADATTGTSGITGMSANNATTDPTITYTVATKPSESVDLLWGVAPTGGLSYTNVANTTTTVTAGLPLINLLKPAKEQKIKFLFKHALARLGMTVVAAVDQIPAGGTLGAGTKIYVNSVKITDAATTATIPSSATLNLNNTSKGEGIAYWTDPVTTTPFTCTINSANELNANLQGSAETQEKAGVTTSETPVLADGKYLMLIPTPGTAATLKVEIDYTVITNDDKLSASYAETNNKITKTVTLTSGASVGFTNNKAYNLKLILGLTSVKLDAEVAEWEIAGSTEVDLPKNK